MVLPNKNSIEIPILQELAAVGGADNLRFLYLRLADYFPQLSEVELTQIKNETSAKWRSAVQKAGKNLNDFDYLTRERGLWKITPRGLEKIETQILEFTSSKPFARNLTHTDIQEMLVEIGINLGFFAVAEFEYYDVIWRENEKSTRISHVFEVQNKGNIDSAFAKLKRAYEAQRSKPFLIVSSERDLNRSKKSLNREFQDISLALRILTFAQIEKVHQNLSDISNIIKEFLLK